MIFFFSVAIAVKYIFTVAKSATYFSKLFMLSSYKYLDRKNTMMGNILKERKIR